MSLSLDTSQDLGRTDGFLYILIFFNIKHRDELDVIWVFGLFPNFLEGAALMTAHLPYDGYYVQNDQGSHTVPSR